MKIFALVFVILTTSAMALEVDEKLTVRVVKTSETRKTVMLNRGTEDGLVEGDHAKFIVTAGIVARAVVIKVSPTRSIWSVYRLVNADYIANDSVMTIKITPPVKITKDESQALVREDTPTKVGLGDPSELGIPLADGANDLASADSVERADLRALEEDEAPRNIVNKSREIFGIINVSGLSASTKTDSGDDKFTNSQSSQYIGIGGEYYPTRERAWYSRFSLMAAFNVQKQDSQSYLGASSTNDIMEFVGGINWHPTKMPSETMTFIPYVNLSASMGSVKSTFKPGQENPGGPEFDANGTTAGFALGFGYKFYTASGFGARAILDYYMRSESYKEDDATNKFNKTVAGPRFMLGLSYRF